MTIIDYNPSPEELEKDAAYLRPIISEPEPNLELSPIGWECPCGQTYGMPCSVCNCGDVVDLTPINL
ncbi:hypothetical protein QQ054_10755 [Oscillatoria amoena NRMC-F 0135]|nr:hypothetical protein [Oscillatoria amoena NRMC-F 0135]